MSRSSWLQPANFKTTLRSFVLLADFAGQGVEGGVVRFGKEQDARELVIAGLEEIAQAVGGGGDDDVVIVGTEQLGGFVQHFAGLADEQEAAAGEAGAAGFCLDARGLGKVGLRQPDLEAGADAFGGLDGDGALLFFHGEAGVVEAQAGAFGLGGEKGIENRGQMALLDAAAGVFDGQANARQARGDAFYVFQGAAVIRGGRWTE